MTTHRRTLYGAIAQTAQLLRCPMPILPNSTLNQAFGVMADATLTANDSPSLQGFCIGNGAHTATTVGKLTRIISLDHKSRFSGLFNTMPLVLREVGNDLAPADRVRYAMRAIIAHEGVNYIAYYMRLMDTTTASIRAELRTVVNNTTSSEDFVPSLTDLFPEPEVPDPNQANPTTGQYLVASAQIPFRLDAFDVSEILNAASILFGDEELAFVSEIGLVTGVKRAASSPDGAGGSVSVQEIVCAQISSFIEAMQPLHSQRDGITITYEIGANEPLVSYR